MFKMKQQHTISELDEQSLRLVSGGTGETTTVETSSEDETETSVLSTIVGGTKRPPP